MTLDPQPYPQLEVAITPLIDAAGGPVDPDDILWPDQYEGAKVTHPLNDGRTGEVTLSMDDPLVEGLEPWEQALRILYYRPGDEVGEPIFWGQCNVVDDYEAGTVKLLGQDPSVRCMHHYLRIGDDALNDPSDDQKGRIPPDWVGIALLIEAAQAPSGPVLGIEVFNDSGVEIDKLIEVERSQEIWAMVLEIAGMVTGPDFDMDVAGSLSAGVYVFMSTFEHLGRDLTATVRFDRGLIDPLDPDDSLDNATQVAVTPSHPTTHAHVVDRDREWRSTGLAPSVVGACGMWVDWIATDHDVVDGDTTVLEETAKARIRAYGRPLKETGVELRPDAAQLFYYGSPNWSGVGKSTGDFYIGDRVKVRARRGFRSLDADYRITAIDLAQPAARGPVATTLTIVPHAAPLDVTLDTDET